MAAPVGVWRLADTNAAISGIGEGSQSWTSPGGVGASCGGINAAIFGNDEGSRRWLL